MKPEPEFPRRAIMRAIDAGVAKANPTPARRYRRLRGTLIAAGVLLAAGGATTVTAAATGNLPDALRFLLPATTKYYADGEVRPTAAGNRQAKAFTMQPGLEYVARPAKKASQRQIAPGFYDIEVTKGNYADVMGTLIPRGGTFRGYAVRESNAVYDLNAGTEVRFTPAKLAPIAHTGATYSIASPFGSYNVGTQLPAGYYRLRATSSLKQYRVRVFYDVTVDAAKHHGTGGLSFNDVLTEADQRDRVIQVVANTPLTIDQPATGKHLPDPAGSVTLQLTKITKAEAKRLGAATVTGD